MAYGAPLGSLQYKLTGINMNAVGDTPIVGLPSKYLILNAVAFNPSTTFGASLATLGLGGVAGGGAPVLVTPVVLTSLVLAADLVPLTLLLTTKVRTEATLYARCAVVNGAAATVDLVINVLPLI